MIFLKYYHSTVIIMKLDRQCRKLKRVATFFLFMVVTFCIRNNVSHADNSNYDDNIVAVTGIKYLLAIDYLDKLSNTECKNSINFSFKNSSEARAEIYNHLSPVNASKLRDYLSSPMWGVRQKDTVTQVQEMINGRDKIEVNGCGETVTKLTMMYKATEQEWTLVKDQYGFGRNR